MSQTALHLLQRRCRELEDLALKLRAIVGMLQKDLEVTESVGCAFAFDLARGEDVTKPWEEVQ